MGIGQRERGTTMLERWPWHDGTGGECAPDEWHDPHPYEDTGDGYCAVCGHEEGIDV